VARQLGGHFREFHTRLFEELTPEERAGLELGLGGLIRALEKAGKPRHLHLH
jgi:hypothetical protein